MNKITFRFLGGVLILSGISVWLNPVYFSSRFGMTFDFTSISIPFGLILCGAGVYFILSTFKEKK